MKITIKKEGKNASIEVEFNDSPSKKPATVMLTPGQVELLSDLLRSASKADMFAFSYEVK